jgi:hypothetical protein
MRVMYRVRVYARKSSAAFGLRMMRLNTDVALFVAVCEERSIAAAAQPEHATQPGVSQHIRKLEGAMGVALFTREAAGMQPNAPRRDLLPFLRSRRRRGSASAASRTNCAAAARFCMTTRATASRRLSEPR